MFRKLWLICSFTILPAILLADQLAEMPAKTVFLIVMENRDLESVLSDPNTPFIHKMIKNGTLFEKYHSSIPPLRPSQPNYIYMLAGKVWWNDNLPPAFHQVPYEADNLMRQLDRVGIPWKGYMEGISGLQCPDFDFGTYAVKHDPFPYFEYVTRDPKYCIQHVRPFTELFGDMEKGTVPHFVFITPDMCHDGHDCGLDAVDTWLGWVVPEIQKSAAYRNNGVIFLTWEEPMPSDGPVGLIAVGPSVKVNYISDRVYTHASLLKTLQKIFGLKPFLGDAAKASDLFEFFENRPGIRHLKH